MIWHDTGLSSGPAKKRCLTFRSWFMYFAASMHGLGSVSGSNPSREVGGGVAAGAWRWGAAGNSGEVVKCPKSAQVAFLNPICSWLDWNHREFFYGTFRTSNFPQTVSFSIWRFHPPGDVFSDPILRGQMILVYSFHDMVDFCFFEMSCRPLRVFDLVVLVWWFWNIYI